MNKPYKQVYVLSDSGCPIAVSDNLQTLVDKKNKCIQDVKNKYSNETIHEFDDVITINTKETKAKYIYSFLIEECDFI
jgi:hypothetical protein